MCHRFLKLAPTSQVAGSVYFTVLNACELCPGSKGDCFRLELCTISVPAECGCTDWDGHCCMIQTLLFPLGPRWEVKGFGNWTAKL